MRGVHEVNLPVPSVHDLPLNRVHAVVSDPYGNGRVENERPNGHLSGSVVWNRAEDTMLGRKRKLHILSLDSAYLQIGQIFDVAMDEATRIAGPAVNPQQSEPGELQKLRESRRLLGEWYDLTGVQKLDMKLFFGDMEAVRSRARNPHNVSAGERAGKMKNLQDRTGRDNPGAIRAMTHPEEADLTKRATQIVREVIAANDNRHLQVLDWLIAEDGYSDRALDALEAIAEQPDDTNRLGDLFSVVSNVRFRVQAFNQMAHAIQPTGRRIEDESIIRVTQRGIEFDRTRGNLMKPFRQLGARTLGFLTENYSQTVGEHLPEIEEIIAQLGEMSIGGPYDTVVDNLIATAEQTAAALQVAGKAKEVRDLAKRFKWLATYYCLPGDAQYGVWYDYQLYGQRRH
jgi:hypothetical protein